MGLHILEKSLPLSRQDVYMSTPTRQMTSGIIVAPGWLALLWYQKQDPGVTVTLFQVIYMNTGIGI